MEIAKTLYGHMVPVCGELLWLELFSMLNFIFSIVALCETCVVLFLAWHTDPHLLPPWLVELVWACTPHRVIEAAKASAAVPVDVLPPERQTTDAVVPRSAAHWSLITAHKVFKAETSAASLASKFARAAGIAKPRPADFGGATRAAEEDGCERLTLFERCFTELDEDAVAGISVAEGYVWFSYTAMHASNVDIWDALDAANNGSDEILVLSEFMHACCLLLWNVPTHRLRELHTTHQVVMRQRQMKNLAYWRRAAKDLDRQARLWVPTFYFTFLMALFNLDLTDTISRTRMPSHRPTSPRCTRSRRPNRWST